MEGLLLNQKPAKRRRLPRILRRRMKLHITFPVWKLPGIAAGCLRAIGDLPGGLVRAVCSNPFMPKAVFVSCAALLGAGAVFLVSFALISPELPPDSMVAVLNGAAASVPEGSPGDILILPPEDQDWAALSAWDGSEERTGAGTSETDRSADFEYRVRPEETLSEIAYAYSIPLDVLAYYNRIANPNRIRTGTVIKIPSYDNEKAASGQMARQPRRNTAAQAGTRQARISYETRASGDLAGSGITVHFSIVDPPAETLQSFEWDFGDGKRGFRPDPIYEYTVPKTYVARLTARDASGIIYRSNSVYIDVPHPESAAEYSTTKFITLSSPDDFFVVNGIITAVARYPSVGAAPLDFSESDQYLTKVRFTKPGFYGVTVREASHPEQYYSIFVSPVPTMHAAAQENFNWYRTQFNTGTTSNCGPASASMAIGWSIGKYFPVSSVRESVGWQGEGGTSLEELFAVIKKNEVPAAISPVRTVQQVKDVIDSGGIAIVLFHTNGVKTTRQDPAQDLFGKYYNDSVGHYIVIKGYSLDGEYFVIYDPIPGDWGSNSFRYGDDISMMGRNRYYPSAELLGSLRRPDMIVVPRKSN
jgi:PKD repeat protein/LysM repeat protein